MDGAKGPFLFEKKRFPELSAAVENFEKNAARLNLKGAPSIAAPEFFQGNRCILRLHFSEKQGIRVIKKYWIICLKILFLKIPRF